MRAFAWVGGVERAGGRGGGVEDVDDLKGEGGVGLSGCAEGMKQRGKVGFVGGIGARRAPVGGVGEGCLVVD